MNKLLLVLLLATFGLQAEDEPAPEEPPVVIPEVEEKEAPLPQDQFDRDYHTLTEWRKADPELFKQLFTGVHKGQPNQLEKKFTERQVALIVKWMQERPRMFLLMYAGAWPDAAQNEMNGKRLRL